MALVLVQSCGKKDEMQTCSKYQNKYTEMRQSNIHTFIIGQHLNFGTNLLKNTIV